jgi:hypothetical protein
VRQAYISGPYSNPDLTRRQVNIERALMAALALLHAGWLPICPHVSMNHDTEWTRAISKDRDVLYTLNPKIDALVTLASWGESPGACEEVKLAHELGIPCLTLNDATRGGACLS